MLERSITESHLPWKAFASFPFYRKSDCLLNGPTCLYTKSHYLKWQNGPMALGQINDRIYPLLLSSTKWPSTPYKEDFTHRIVIEDLETEVFHELVAFTYCYASVVRQNISKRMQMISSGFIWWKGSDPRIGEVEKEAKSHFCCVTGSRKFNHETTRANDQTDGRRLETTPSRTSVNLRIKRFCK